MHRNVINFCTILSRNVKESVNWNCHSINNVFENFIVDHEKRLQINVILTKFINMNSSHQGGCWARDKSMAPLSHASFLQCYIETFDKSRLSLFFFLVTPSWYTLIIESLCFNNCYYAVILALTVFERTVQVVGLF